MAVRDVHPDVLECSIRQFSANAKVDLSGSADATPRCPLPVGCDWAIEGVDALYTEASSANTGVACKVGHILRDGSGADDDSIATYTSEVSIAIDTRKPLTLLTTLNGSAGSKRTRPIVPGGSTLTFASAGGKTGTGEIIFVVTATPVVYD